MKTGDLVWQDSQHQQLLALIEELKTSLENGHQILKKLAVYVDQHFSLESGIRKAHSTRPALPVCAVNGACAPDCGSFGYVIAKLKNLFQHIQGRFTPLIYSKTEFNTAG